MGHAQAAIAYAALSPALTSPGRAEARVFATVTRRLQAIFSDENASATARAEALHANRRLWLAAATESAGDDNEMPGPLRASIIGLAGFVDRHTSQVLRGAGSPDILIEINTRVAAGLSAGAS
jgi:flagellar protein FlaF